MKYEEIEELELTASECRTVGYVYRETETEFVLFSSLGFDRGLVDELGDGLVIPKSVVRVVRDLTPLATLVAA